MTQEEKQLLLVDLCARIPYKVKCSYERILPEGYLLSNAQAIGIINNITIPFVGEITVKIDGSLRGLSDFKMYLRPLDSMTEEEKSVLLLCNAFIEPRSTEYKVNFYNQHHLDYRDLIEKGLAIKAPEGIYKI